MKESTIIADPTQTNIEIVAEQIIMTFGLHLTNKQYQTLTSIISEGMKTQHTITYNHILKNITLSQLK